MKKLIIITILFLSSFSYAELPTIKITLLRGRAPIEYSKGEAKRVFKRSARKIKSQLGVILKVRKWIDLPMVNIPSYYAYNIHGWASVFKYNNKIRGSVFLFSPPPLDLRTLEPVIMGIASHCAPTIGIGASSFAPLIRFTGKEFAHASIAATHELAHMLGANHWNDETPATIMHWSALSFLEPQDFKMKFANHSRVQVRNCLKRWGK